MTATIATGARFSSADEPAGPAVLFGRFMLPDMTEYPCQVSELTVDGAIFSTAAAPEAATQIVAYIDEIGRVEGQSADAVPGGFRIIFSHKGQRRERFANRLAGRADKNTTAGTDLRRHARYAPEDGQSYITLPDGRIYPCEILDISLSGAAVKVDVMPSLGTYLMLGKMRGRIVRYIDQGIAIEFLKPLNTAQLAGQVR
ncbi:MAG: PilZ domain-containing protein [Pseudomonadota bacterium]